MKTCTKCLTDKPLDDFYVNNRTIDKRKSCCKDCSDKHQKAWAKNNKEKIRRWNKIWCKNNKEKTSLTKKKWRMNNKDKTRTYSKKAKQRIKSLGRAETYTKIQRLRDKGIIIPQPCEVCRDKKTEGHHDDYSKPLDLRWFCHSCHMAHHAKLRANNSPLL